MMAVACNSIATAMGWKVYGVLIVLVVFGRVSDCLPNPPGTPLACVLAQAVELSRPAFCDNLPWTTNSSLSCSSSHVLCDDLCGNGTYSCIPDLLSIADGCLPDHSPGKYWPF